MKIRALFLITFLVFLTPKVWSIDVVPKVITNKIDLLLTEADSLKYQNSSLGLAKVKEAEQLAVQLDSDEKLGDVYTMFGIYYYIAGTYDLSLQMYLKAIVIHEKYHNDQLIARSLNGVGLIQSAFNQLDESIKTFEKSIKIDTRIRNYIGVARSYYNIAMAQIEKKDYDKATNNLKLSLTYAKKDNSSYVNYMVDNRLGDMMLMKGKIDSAFYYYKGVVNNPNVVPNNWENAYAYAGLANAYVKIEDYESAEKNGLLSYEYAQKINARWDLASISKLLSEIYEKKSNTDKAYKYLLLHSAFEDTLYSERKLNDVNYLQLKSKEVENLQLLNENEVNEQKAKRDRIIIYSFSILIIFLVVFVFLIRRNAKMKDIFNEELNLKNKNIENQKSLITVQNRELIALNESKNRLFSIVSHDLRTPLANIVQTLNLQKDKSLSPEMLDEIYIQLQKQTEDASTMLNDLLQWSTTQMDGQHLNFEFVLLNTIVDSVFSFYEVELNKKNITYSSDNVSDDLYVYADLAQVRVIVQNVIANAIKYTVEKGLIKLHYSVDDTFVNLHIFNSGKEIQEAKISQILQSDKRLDSELGTSLEEGTGLGMLLVKQFLANNKGMLDIKTIKGEGTEFIISFLRNSN